MLHINFINYMRFGEQTYMGVHLTFENLNYIFSGGEGSVFLE